MAIKIGGAFKTKSEEDYLVELLKEQDDFKALKHFYGATAAFCPRQNFLMFRDWPNAKNTSSTSSLYMNIGNGIEAALVNALVRNDKLFATNIYIPKVEPKISGKVDLVYIDNLGRLTLGEVKSCGKLPYEPKFGHLWQTYCYSAVTGIQNVNIIYVSRNVLGENMKIAMRVFPVEIDERILKLVFNKVMIAKTAIDGEWIPPIPADFRKSYECGFCMFKDSICWTPTPDVEFLRLSNKEFAEIEKLIEPEVQRLIDERPLRLTSFLNEIKQGSTADPLPDYIKSPLSESRAALLDAEIASSISAASKQPKEIVYDDF